MNSSRERFTAALRHALRFKGLEHSTYAVLVPLVYSEAGAELLIEVRAAGISQAGAPCFPGGRIEQGESPVRAAIREIAEELGITVQTEQVLGQLPTVHTMLGSKTNIYVCMISMEQLAEITPNPAEVSEVLRIPLTSFLERANERSFNVIWGMTAGPIQNLCRILMDETRFHAS
jgi:mutator protein MutT